MDINLVKNVINGTLARGGGGLPPPGKKIENSEKTAFRGPPNFDVFDKQYLWGILVKKMFWSHDVILKYDIIFSQK